MKTSASFFLTDILPHKRKFLSRLLKNKVFKNTEPDKVLSALKKSGIEGIELILPFSRKTTDEDVLEVKALLDKHNLPILSVHQVIRFFTKTKMQEITEIFSLAALLSAKVIVLHTNNAGKQVFDKVYIEALHALQKKHNIKIGFENMEKDMRSRLKPHTWHHEHFPTLIKKNKFNITLDTTHLAHAGGDIIAFFKKHKDHIVNIHISDYKRHAFNSSIRPLRYRHMPLGAGDLPIKEFIATLQKEKYNGLVTMEINGDLDGMCDSARLIKYSATSKN